MHNKATFYVLQFCYRPDPHGTLLADMYRTIQLYVNVVVGFGNMTIVLMHQRTQ